MNGERWERRPRLALLLRVVIFLAPAVVATDVSVVVSRALPRPYGVAPTIVWWLVILGVSALALVVFDRLFRRLLPLTVLLDLALVFPGVAPSRFSAAFRSGTVKNLQRRIEQAKDDAAGSDTGRAAATVVELVASLAVHDPRTRGHSERTRAYSDLIAEELGLPAEDRDRLRWSALLHDIGKLHVPASLLNKSGRPDPDEWEVLRRHPAEGALIAGGLLGWLGPWGLAIEHHHEKFDGTGYPHGLAGEQISLAGRIVSVADSYEVMTSARSYNAPVTPEAAREELVRCAGGHFDPEVVRAFLRVSLARFPKPAGLFVGLLQLPGFFGVEQLLQRAGSALAAGAAVLGLAVGGFVVPGGPGIGGAASGGPSALGAGGPSANWQTSQARRGASELSQSALDAALAAAFDAAAPSSTTAPADEPAVPAPATAVPAASGAVLAIAPLPVAPPPPAPTPAAPTTLAPPPTTSTTAGPPRPGFYLGGTTASQAASPAELVTARPGGTGTPDYDGDGRPGRTLAPSPNPATTAAPGEHQLWIAHFAGPVTLSGTPTLTIPSAVVGFGSGKGDLRGFLLDCDAGGGSCAGKPLSTAVLNVAQWSDGSGGFASKTLSFSSLNTVLGAGRTLVLRLGVQSGSSTLMIAYGTSSQPAFLAIGVA